jgi:hypothetical protein
MFPTPPRSDVSFASIFENQGVGLGTELLQRIGDFRHHLVRSADAKMLSEIRNVVLEEFPVDCGRTTRLLAEAPRPAGNDRIFPVVA